MSRRGRAVERARRRSGAYVLKIEKDLAQVLGALGRQLDPLLDDPSADPGLRRLFPPAHTEDVLAEAAWQIEQGSQLRDARREALAALAQPSGATLTEDQLVTWMQGLNTLRLVLAERLGVSDDPGHEEAALEAALDVATSEDPNQAELGRDLVQAWVTYQHLGLLISDAVDAMVDPA